MVVTRKRFRLAAKYADGDLYVDLSPRVQEANLVWLCSQVFPQETLNEFTARGFALNTLRFHIDMTEEAIRDYEKRKAGRT